MNILLVALGGFFGSIARFYLAGKINRHLLGTWLANLTGSLLLGVVLRLYLSGVIAEEAWLLAGVGFCGAYTTFSTFGNEGLDLLMEKQYITAGRYIISSVVLSLFLVWVVLAL